MTVFRTLGLGTVIFDYSGASELSYRALDCSRDNLLTLPFPLSPPCTEPLGGSEQGNLT